MPDSSDSSMPGANTPEEDSPGKTPEPPAAAKIAEPLSLVPRSRSASAKAKDNAAAAPAAGPASAGDFISWIKMFAASLEAAPTPATETAKPGARLQRTTLPKEQRKFQRPDREGGVVEKPAVPVTDAGVQSVATVDRPAADSTPIEPSIEDERSSAPSSQPVPIPLTGGTSGRRAKTATPRHPYFWLAMQAVVLILLVASFLLGRASVAKKAEAPRNAAPAAPGAVAEGDSLDILNPEVTGLINEAMASEQDRQFDKAAELLAKVQQLAPQVRDVDYHLALLAVEKNDTAKALPLLNLAIAQGEQPGSAYKLRGTIRNRMGLASRGRGDFDLSRRGGVTRGMSDFENATKVDPFSADNFFFWGEALRRAGKPQAALEKLQLAIDRLREPALEAQYRLKIRLTQIELGQEQAFAAEMAQQLAENPPPGDWLLTAAALELHRDNYAAAAGYLDKASAIMEKDIFATRLRDYFFYSYRDRKPLERFFVPAAATTPGVVAKPSPTPADAAAAASPSPAAALAPGASLATPTPAVASTPAPVNP